MHRRRAALGPAHMHTAVAEIDRVPAQRYNLGSAQPVTIGDQHHSRITVAVAVIASSLDQPLDLGLSQVLARPDLGIWPAPGRTLQGLNCPINSGRRD